MRVAAGGISYETSTFTLVETDLDSFRERAYMHGTEITEAFAGTNTPIGGFMDGAQTHGFEIVPTVFAEALPSGPVPRAIFDTIVDELLSPTGTTTPEVAPRGTAPACYGPSSTLICRMPACFTSSIPSRSPSARKRGWGLR